MNIVYCRPSFVFTSVSEPRDLLSRRLQTSASVLPYLTANRSEEKIRGRNSQVEAVLLYPPRLVKFCHLTLDSDSESSQIPNHVT